MVEKGKKRKMTTLKADERENIKAVKITFENGGTQIIHAGTPSEGYVVPCAIETFSDIKHKKVVKCCVTYVYEDYVENPRYVIAPRCVAPASSMLKRADGNIWFVVGKKPLRGFTALVIEGAPDRSGIKYRKIKRITLPLEIVKKIEVCER